MIGIIMGSDSDLPVMKDAAVFLEEIGLSFELTLISAHRTPERLVEYAKNARKRGVKVIIAGAGGAAHLPGMVASMTTVPVIGVPVKTSALSGIDSLYSIVQMPSGIPVATVAINGAKNAGILAAEMIGITDSVVYDKVENYKKNLTSTVLEKAQELDKIKYHAYLHKMDK